MCRVRPIAWRSGGGRSPETCLSSSRKKEKVGKIVVILSKCCQETAQQPGIAVAAFRLLMLEENFSDLCFLDKKREVSQSLLDHLPYILESPKVFLFRFIVGKLALPLNALLLIQNQAKLIQ